MRNRKELIDFLHELERRYPVTSWSASGIDIWPLLKSQIFFWQFDAHNKRTATKSRRSNKWLSLALSFFKFIVFYFKPLKKADFVFSGASSYRSGLGEAHSMNRYFDPMMDYLTEHRDRNCVLVEYGTLKTRTNLYKPERIVFLKDYFSFISLITKLFWWAKTKRIVLGMARLDECLKEVERELGILKYPYMANRLTSMILSIHAWGCLYTILFKKVSAKYSFGLCYYALPMFGMNYSAHTNDVVSVDMQHGTQGPLHIAYSYFKEKDGRKNEKYTTLPAYFWCWNEGSGETIKGWLNHSIQGVIVGGNPWIDFVMKSNFTISNRRISTNRLILYTLQPIGDILDQYIIDCIKESCDSFEWWLRLHPRQINERKLLETILIENELIGKVVINDPYEIPLPIVLKDTFAHISKFSGSVIEASLMGVPTIVLDDIGKESFYESNLDNVYFIKAQTSEDLLRDLNSLRSLNIDRTSNSDFTVSLNKMIGNLEKV